MYFTSKTLGAGLTLAGVVSADGLLKRSPEPALSNGKYLVDRQAEFDNHLSFSFDGDSLPEGLTASDYGAGSPRQFVPRNAFVKDGYLQLKVDGGATSQPYICGEVATDVSNILYGSVRTVAILTEPAGVCNGMFFYQSDTQETDIEWLSDANSQSNQGTRQLWLTNQDANGDGEATDRAIPPPSDPTNTEHEYRLDWTEGRVQWFVDGEQVWETTEDVPSVPGPWLWNNWSNGDKGWSAGPPEVDAIFKIRSIDMYYNTA